MIRKFAAVPGFRVVTVFIFFATILVGARPVCAQQPADQQPSTQQQPAQSSAQQPTADQPPAAQQPSSQQPTAQQPGNPQSSEQEAAPEESTQRPPKPKGYKNWTFNVGGGASLTTGTTKGIARSGGGVATAGAARNFNKYFGFRADFEWDDLPLRNTALELAQAPGATSHLYTLMVNPIINVPVTKEWGGYLIFGPAYYHRSGQLDSSTALPGSSCNPFFSWWGRCYNSILPLNGNFLSESVNQFGEDFGGGVTHVIRPNIEIYVEFRLLHGSHNGNTTDLRPITLGLRW
jgi:hypothetical protein